MAAGKITQSEIMGNHSVPEGMQGNLDTLLHRLNLFRELYGQPMVVSSGFRSMEDHLRIYAEKGITDKAKIPMGSGHLSAMACDFSDPKGVLKEWIAKNPTVLDTCNLYMEHPSATPTWLHLDTKARVVRVFNP